MKQSIFLLKEQKAMVIIAMNYNRSTLRGINKRLFDIAFNKVNQIHNPVELDGMEMILVSQSLHKYGKFLSNSKQIKESKQYRIYGDVFEEIRKNFQSLNGPKIKKTKTA
ncbi:hypothetical protein M4D71_23610 [Niallia taxi]|uniref:hypothetical protein n=1 Tax=Niallia taxi TaxID=2499688 RepID=UPI0021A42582|nr:hypothetical protein [Niallia taxi]MCT2347142.1 hypothetical protein [Niallia taxi]